MTKRVISGGAHLRAYRWSYAPKTYRRGGNRCRSYPSTCQSLRPSNYDIKNLIMM